MQPKFLTGKKVETYAARDGDNPIAVLVEAVLKNPQRRKRIAESKDPIEAIEQIKKFVSVRRLGQGTNGSWQYNCYIPQFDTHFKIMANSRLAEFTGYNPFK